MKHTFSEKSVVEEIRRRFDHDAERFSNLETGQQTTIDSPLCLELITDAAKLISPNATNLLDIGCGTGNYTLKMLRKKSNLNCTLIDLSLPMLERAKERVSAETSGQVEFIQADIRNAELPEEHYDIILASSVLHHLKDDAEWEAVFAKLYRSLRPGGSLWIYDLVRHDSPELETLFDQRYADYLNGLGGPEFRDKILAYIAKEDAPRSISYQAELMRRNGFSNIEILHKNQRFAAFGGVKK